ncbi:hypothetical protein D3C78_661700 [compost metagenome]
MFGALDRDIATDKLAAQVLLHARAVFHVGQGVFDGDRQAQVAALIGPALDRGAGVDLLDHTQVTAQQARGNRQVRVGVGAGQAVFHAHGVWA